MTENDAIIAGGWARVKAHIEGVWRDKYPLVLPRLLPGWFTATFSEEVSLELEAVLHDAIKLTIIETATHKLKALGVGPAPDRSVSAQLKLFEAMGI